MANMTIREIIEEAWERVGVEPRSGYQFRTARRSLNLLLQEWSNRGLNMWTIEDETLPFVVGTATYTLATDTVDLIEAAVRDAAGQELSISRISVDTYSKIPNKTTQGRPNQYFIRRLIGDPTITLWPVPDYAYTLAYWRLRRMTEAGTDAALSPDIPFRFIPALIAGIAYYLSLKTPGAEQRVVLLKQVYEESFTFAIQEDRERASLMIVPMRSV
jgi:hypothetical protein